MTSQPIFLNTKLPSTEEGRLELFKRWERYGSMLESLTSAKPKKIIVVLAPSYLPRDLGHFPNIFFIPTRRNSFASLRVLGLIFKTLVRENSTRFVLISGITPVDMIAGILFKSLLRDRIFLQGQFHGDTYHFGNKFSIIAFCRTLISRQLIRFSDSIRVVSEFQVQEINKFHSGKETSFIVSPLPINPKLIIDSPVKKNENLVAVVGRLHPERGLQELANLIGRLSSSCSEVKFEVAGDGPLRLTIERLERQFPTQVKYWGQLNSRLLSELYGRSSFLLSAAPSEGYGMALREAIYNDVQIIAKKCTGTESLKREFPERVHLFETTESAIEILKSLMSRTKIRRMSRVPFSDQQSKEVRNMEKLVKSWIL